MKVFPFKIPKPEQNALVFQEDYGVVFYDKLHQHEDLQLSVIVEGEGTLIVGDTINEYKPGDILIIGSYLPHVFKSDPQANNHSHMLSLFFTKNTFGKDFFELEMFHELKSFFKRSKHGFKITSQQNTIQTSFSQLKGASKLSQFIISLEVLKTASKANYKSLSSFIYDKKYTEREGKRLSAVFEYTMSHFDNEITLDQISDVANMSKNAFCKYFKRRTNKTYFRFLNELRVEHACKLLCASKELTIAEVASTVGFNNLSNFNRQFKAIKSVSPSEYRKQ
ncbi:helix-turn-helix domain-containing protein [Lacinutrix neustonica]|uniref:Helix-turn-helix domain-containing protein n=1 Tax=Lacinutrix neustonica TaxID=2980107 RepID=A0A9E8SCT9_9FLAO|nr:helix-turn-helix domain-containing protein [Lacinutrix neustonica]WAC01356.1 helix-turn-helix domain-containing protein [Lacinutrix neustonica]